MPSSSSPSLLTTPLPGGSCLMKPQFPTVVTDQQYSLLFLLSPHFPTSIFQNHLPNKLIMLDFLSWALDFSMKGNDFGFLLRGSASREGTQTKREGFDVNRFKCPIQRFSTFPMLCSLQNIFIFFLVPKRFSSILRKPGSVLVTATPLSQPLVNRSCVFCLWICLFQTCFINKIIPYVRKKKKEVFGIQERL